MKLLIVSGSPQEKKGSDYYAVDPWIRIPQQLSNHLEQVTLWSPVVDLGSGFPTNGSWRVGLGNLDIASHDYFNSFFTYYKRGPFGILPLRFQVDQLIKKHDIVLLRIPTPLISLVTRRTRLHGKPLISMILANIATQANCIVNNQGIK